MADTAGIGVAYAAFLRDPEEEQETSYFALDVKISNRVSSIIK